MSYAKNYFTANLKQREMQREKKSQTKCKLSNSTRTTRAIDFMIIHHQEYQMSRVKTLNMTGPGQPISLLKKKIQKKKIYEIEQNILFINFIKIKCL